MGPLAHGPAPPEPSGLTWLLAWPVEPVLWGAIGAAAWAYARAARAVPAFPRWRRRCFGAGLAVLALALAGPLDAYDTTLFWVHMNQHLLLTLVAAPLLDLGAPLALAVRATSPRWRRRVARVVHSAPLRALAHPLLAWCAFVGVLWVSHFSPLYNLALESEPVHVLEHVLYLGSGLLFWWPVVGADPGARRLPHPARLGYLFVAMPAHAFLGLAILSAGAVLYPHYLELERAWGPTPLQDQQLAGVVMWVEGGLVLVVAFVLALGAWLRHDERSAARVDRRLARLSARWGSPAGSEGENGSPPPRLQRN